MGHQNFSCARARVHCWPWWPASQCTPLSAMWHCATGMTKVNTPLVSPFRVMLMYIRPLFKMRLLWMQKNILPCFVSASAPRHSLRRMSYLGGGIPFLRQSHLRHAARVTSASWACSQSTTCISSSFAA